MSDSRARLRSGFSFGSHKDYGPEAGDPEPLAMWAVYDHPSDYPADFVARKWTISSGCAVPSLQVILTDNLESLRGYLSEIGLASIGRSADDDPAIVEVWL